MFIWIQIVKVVMYKLIFQKLSIWYFSSQILYKSFSFAFQVQVVFSCLLGIFPPASVFVLAFGWWIERLVRPEPNGFLFWTQMVYWVEFSTCWEAVNMPNFERLPLICYSIPFNLLVKKRSRVCVCVRVVCQSRFTRVAMMLLVQQTQRKTTPNPVFSPLI